MHYRSEIEECPDQDTSKMQAKLSIVPIDQLSLFIGKKVQVEHEGIDFNVGACLSMTARAQHTFIAYRLAVSAMLHRPASIRLCNGFARVQLCICKL